MKQEFNAVKMAEVVKAHREELQKEGEQAYREAKEYKGLLYKVDIDEDGNISSWYQAAGGNSFTQSVFENRAITVIQFCYQYDSIEVTDEMIYEKLEEKGIDREETDAAVEEAGDSLYMYLYEKDKELIQEIEKEQLEWEINEYAYQEVDRQIDNTLEQMEDMR